MRRLLVAPLVFSIAIACGSFGSGEETTPSLDASAPIDDAASVDVTSPSDAAPDVLDDAGELGCGFVEFVDAFDRDDVQGTWLIGPTMGEGVTVSSAIAPMAKGKSWQVDVLPVDDGGRYRNYEHVPARPATPVPSCIDLSFSIYPAAVGGTGMAVGSIELDSTTSISLWIRSNQSIDLVEQTTDGTQFFVMATAALPGGQWHSIRVRYRYDKVIDRRPFFIADGKPISVAALKLDHGEPQWIYFGAGFSPSDTSAKYWLDELRVR